MNKDIITSNNYLNNTSLFDTNVRYPTFHDIDNKNYNNFTINSDSIICKKYITSSNITPENQSQNVIMKKCPYCNLEFEIYELVNHIDIHESQITLYSTTPNSISNNYKNEFPKFEDITDPADEFEVIDKKEVEKLIEEEEKLKGYKITTSSFKSIRKVNISQVKSTCEYKQCEPKKKTTKSKKSDGLVVVLFIVEILRVGLGIALLFAS